MERMISDVSAALEIIPRIFVRYLNVGVCKHTLAFELVTS